MVEAAEDQNVTESEQSDNGEIDEDEGQDKEDQDDKGGGEEEDHDQSLKNSEEAQTSSQARSRIFPSQDTVPARQSLQDHSRDNIDSAVRVALTEVNTKPLFSLRTCALNSKQQFGDWTGKNHWQSDNGMVNNTTMVCRLFHLFYCPCWGKVIDFPIEVCSKM